MAALLRSLSLLVVSAVVLSGCASGGNDGDATSSSTSSSGSASSTGTGTASTSTSSTSQTSSSSPSSAPNTAPKVTSFTGNSTGLSATFAFNATDAEGDTVTFTLAFGDGTANVTGTFGANGSNATHLYASAATYNATLVVSDGKLASNKTLTIAVVADGPGAAGQHESADDLVAANVCQGFFFADFDGVLQLAFAIDPATFGLPFTASVDGDGLVGMRVGFFDAGGASVGAIAFAPMTFSGSGTVPAGAVSASVQGCGVGPYTATYDAGA